MLKCEGCDIPLDKRVNLPVDWKEGDPLPKGLTIHKSEKGFFAFQGDPWSQRRIYLKC